MSPTRKPTVKVCWLRRLWASRFGRSAPLRRPRPSRAYASSGSRPDARRAHATRTTSQPPRPRPPLSSSAANSLNPSFSVAFLLEPTIRAGYVGVKMCSKIESGSGNGAASAAARTRAASDSAASSMDRRPARNRDSGSTLCHAWRQREAGYHAAVALECGYICGERRSTVVGVTSRGSDRRPASITKTRSASSMTSETSVQNAATRAPSRA